MSVENKFSCSRHASKPDIRRSRGYLNALIISSLPMLSAATALAAGTFNTLYTFTGGADGAFPYSSVTLDSAGNIYGETDGGAYICPVTTFGLPNNGCGTVFKLGPAAQLTTLVTFAGPNGAVGLGQLALVGTTLFGTTQNGGTADNGVVFSVNTDGSNFQLLHQFSGKEGAYPAGPLIAREKLLYGTATYGGPHANQNHGNNGTLFKIQQNGKFTVLHAFNGDGDGENPNDIVMDSAGTIYGSTHAGGSANCFCGAIFSYVPSTGIFTTLYEFAGTYDGEYPVLGSVGPHGELYGISEYGSRYDGTLFELVPSAAGYTFKLLHRFGSGKGASGNAGSSGPTLLSNGALIGADYTALYYFSPDVPEGFNPATFPTAGAAAQPMPGPDLSVYGTTVNTSTFEHCLSSTGVIIGYSGCGMVYKETLGAPDP